MIQSTLKLYFISFDLINLREILYLQQLNTYVLSLQEAYVYWACSTELPPWHRNAGLPEAVSKSRSLT